MKTNQLTHAHDAAVSCMCVIDENIIASGDDDGCVKIWDLRQQRCCHELSTPCPPPTHSPKTPPRTFSSHNVPPLCFRKEEPLG